MARAALAFGFPPIPPGEALTISATTYVAYRKCPQQAVARLQGRYPAETRASFRGGLAHRIFARHLSTGPIAPDQLARVCREEIGQAMNASLGRVALRPSELRGVISEVGALYDRFKSVVRTGFVGAEVDLEEEVAPGLVLRGSVDAVYDDEAGVRIVDWKTGALWDAEYQLMFYALLWALTRGVLPAAAEAVSVGTGERIEVHPTPTGLAACAELVADLAARARRAFVSGTESARLAGPWCRGCPLLGDCEEGAAAVGRSAG